jgi:hypothetical protein
MESIGYRKISELHPDCEWNYRSDWAIPLPVSYFKVGNYEIVARWFVPDEVPVIPTGWLYQLKNKEIITEQKLYIRINSIW